MKTRPHKTRVTNPDRHQRPRLPLQVGGYCVYGNGTELHAVYELKDGVAVIGREGGARWPEAVALLRGKPDPAG